MNNQAKLQQELASIRSELEPIAFDLKAIAQSNHELDKVVQLLESANALINYSQQSLTASIFSNEQSKSSLTRQSHLPQQSYTYNTSHLNKAKSSPEQQIHLSSRTPPFPPAHSYPTTKCPHCELSVYKNLLNEHIRKMHPGCAPLELPPKPKKAIKKARKSRETNAGILVSQTKKRPTRGESWALLRLER